MILDRLHLGLAAGGVLFAVSGVALHEHDQQVKQQAVAEAVHSAQAEFQKQISYQLADLQNQAKAQDQKYKDQLQRLQGTLGKATSPQQLADLAEHLLSLKQPIRIETPAPTATNPNPQPVAEVSLSDAPQVKAYISECEECNLKLQKLDADAKSYHQIQDLQLKQIDSLKRERDAALTASRGGSVLHRAAKALKYLGIGAIAGAAAVCGSGHCK